MHDVVIGDVRGFAFAETFENLLFVNDLVSLDKRGGAGRRFVD